MTANKQLLSQHGAELLQAAEDSGAFLRFEASSVGAVPVIKVLRESLAAARITGVMGIVNGTTNYILSAMAQSGAEYAPTLARAQELGYAEADPTEDVTGKDAAAKMAILSSIAFHSRVNLERRRTPGHRVDHRRRRGLRQGPRPRAQAARRGQADRGPRQRARLPLLHSDRASAGRRLGRLQRRVPRVGQLRQHHALRPRRRRHADRLGGDRRRHLDRQHGGRRLHSQLHLLQGPRLLPQRRGRLALLPARACGRRARRAGRHRRRVRTRGREHPVHAAERRRRRRAARARLHPVREAAFFGALARIEALPVVRSRPSVVRIEGLDGR